MYEPTWRLPATIDEALADLAAEVGGARLIAGGTDLVPRIRCGAASPPVLIDLSRVEAMHYLFGGDPRAGTPVEIGALVTHGELVQSDLPLLSAASGRVGGPQIRARGTVGGNIANASPAADATTALVALEAELVLASESNGKRRLPLDAFLLGPGETALGPDELIVGVVFDRLDGDASTVYLKEGQRNALAIAVTSVALVLDRARRRLRIALGSVAPTVVRARRAEALFESEWDRAGDRRALTEAVADAAVEAAMPIDDVRASAGHRRALVRALVARGLSEALR
jgi:CO/xanthine dehydrogenase FAD-binding subunit